MRAQAFAEHCTKGHHLQGWVTYCPFCGVLVMQSDGATATGEAAPKIVKRTPEPVPTTLQPEAAMVSGHEHSSPKRVTELAMPSVEVPEPVPRREQIEMQPVRREPPAAESLPTPSQSGKWLAMALMLTLVGGAYFLFKPDSKVQACDVALALSAKDLVSGDATSARNHALLAIASCKGESQAKATSLKATAEQEIATQGMCDLSIQTIDSLVSEHKLQKARSQLNDLKSACSKNTVAERLRQKVSQDQVIADEAAIEVRKLLIDGEVRAANSALEKLAATDREHPNLAALREDLQRLIMVQESRKAEAVELPKVVTERAELPKAPPYPKTVSPSPAPHASQAQSFILSAEQALAQKKFDRAKTQIENALNIDPSNAQATGLARRIKELELQYMRDETVIK